MLGRNKLNEHGGGEGAEVSTDGQGRFTHVFQGWTFYVPWHIGYRYLVVDAKDHESQGKVSSKVMVEPMKESEAEVTLRFP